MSELRPHPASSSLSAVALVALAVLPSARLAPESLVFRATKGARIERHHRTDTTGTLERVEIELGAESRKESDPGVTFETTTTIDVTDEIADVADGRPTHFVRAFDALDRRSVQSVREAKGPKREEYAEHCALAKRAVAFEWSASEKRFVKSVRGEGRSGDDDLLAPLVEDMDLREFLPGAALESGGQGDVAIGTTWKVPFVALKLGVLRPAGRLTFESDNTKRSKVETRLLESVWDAMEGTCRAKLRDVRDEKGTRIGVIAIEADLASRASVSPEAGATSDPAEFDVVYRGTLEGEIEWDVGAGRARALHAEWKTERTLTETRPAKTKDGATVQLRRKLFFRDVSRCRYEIVAL